MGTSKVLPKNVMEIMHDPILLSARVHKRVGKPQSTQVEN